MILFLFFPFWVFLFVALFISSYRIVQLILFYNMLRFPSLYSNLFFFHISLLLLGIVLLILCQCLIIIIFIIIVVVVVVFCLFVSKLLFSPYNECSKFYQLRFRLSICVLFCVSLEADVEYGSFYNALYVGYILLIEQSHFFFFS